MSGDKENLWLNLSDGFIGGGRKNWDGSGGSNGALKIALDMPTEFWAEFRTNRELATQGMSGLVS